jgi:DNA segregation ATPase FtsK/SpoIIIE-like protein
MDTKNKESVVLNQIKECFISGDDISISIIQRRFALGYNSAGRIFDALVNEKLIIRNSNFLGVSKFI